MPLRQLFPDPKGSTPQIQDVDIFAVHGLNPRSKDDASHAWDTWRTPPGPQGHLWLREDLPTYVPRARIFLYEYNSTAVYGKDRGTFIDKANELLEEIRSERDDNDTRPIIFLAHSMGGLLVKQALTNAHNNRKYTPIREATKGLAFFATPHHGGDRKLVSLGKIATGVATAVGLQKGDDVLETLKDGSIFSGIMTEQWRQHILEYDIISFWGGFDDVVPRESTSFGMPGDRENVVKLAADHREVCKFGSSQRDQDNLKLVQRNIQDIYNKALKKVSHHPVPSQTPSSPPCHIIPFRQNRKFVGREAILGTLADEFFTLKECQRIAIVGLGGIGKTQVALQFAYRVKSNQDGYSIFWVPALSLNSFDEACGKICDRLNLPRSDDRDRKETVQQYLSSSKAGKWLLIVDNADQQDILLGNSDTPGIQEFLPDSENGLTLYTTRSRRVAESVAADKILDLQELSPKEALHLFTKSLARDDLRQDQGTIKHLLQELTYLPLAVSQAVSYLNCNRHVSIRRYLELLQGTERDMVSLLSREFHYHGRYSGSQNAIATTWLVSFDQICQQDKIAAELLCFISYIEPKAIPRSILPDADSEVVEHGLGTLSGYAFLTQRENEGLWDIHSLVHLATQIWVKSKPELSHKITTVLRHLEEIFPSDDYSDRDLWREYMPHAVRVLQNIGGVQMAEKDKLSYWVGLCLLSDGRTKEAVGWLEMTDTWRESRLEKDDPDRLASQHELSKAYLEDGQTKRALSILEHVVTVRETTLKEDHPDLLASQHELSKAYLVDGQTKRAVSILEHAVKVEGETLGEDHPDRLASQHELSRAYLEDGQTKRALSILEHVVTVEETTLGEDDPDRLVSKRELAVAYLEDGQTKKAISILEQVVAVEGETLRENHPNRLMAEHELARAYLEDNQTMNAIIILEHIVKIDGRELIEDHPSRLASLRALAIAYGADGQREKAIQLLKKVVLLYEGRFSNEHSGQLMPQHMSIVATGANGRFKKVVQLLEDAVLEESTLSEDHSERLNTQHLLAFAYEAHGQLEEAARLLEHVVRIRGKLLEEDDPTRLLSEQALARVYEARTCQ